MTCPPRVNARLSISGRARDSWASASPLRCHPSLRLGRSNFRNVRGCQSRRDTSSFADHSLQPSEHKFDAHCPHFEAFLSPSMLLSSRGLHSNRLSDSFSLLQAVAFVRESKTWISLASPLTREPWNVQISLRSVIGECTHIARTCSYRWEEASRKWLSVCRKIACGEIEVEKVATPGFSFFRPALFVTKFLLRCRRCCWWRSESSLAEKKQANKQVRVDPIVLRGDCLASDKQI